MLCILYHLLPFILAFGYYGEYPLSIAAVFNHTQIYDFLLQSGADTDAQDSFGNTVLHIVVIHNQIVSLFMYFIY